MATSTELDVLDFSRSFICGTKPINQVRLMVESRMRFIDDAAGKTVASASTLGGKASGANVDAAKQVGSDIAAAAKKAGVTTVVFDRGGFLFHGRVKALADAAREGGLEF